MLWYRTATAGVPWAGGSAWGWFPVLRMPKLQNQQPRLNSTAGTHGMLLIQNKHANTSLCQGVQIPPGLERLNPSRSMAATYHQLLPVNGKTIYPDAHVFYRKTFNSMEAMVSFLKIDCLQALCVEADCHSHRNFFNMLQSLPDCLGALSLQPPESVAALTPMPAGGKHLHISRAWK